MQLEKARRRRRRREEPGRQSPLRPERNRRGGGRQRVRAAARTAAHMTTLGAAMLPRTMTRAEEGAMTRGPRWGPGARRPLGGSAGNA